MHCLDRVLQIVERLSGYTWLLYSLLSDSLHCVLGASLLSLQNRQLSKIRSNGVQNG